MRARARRFRVIRGASLCRPFLFASQPANDTTEPWEHWLPPKSVVELVRLGLLEPTSTNEAWRLTTLGRALLQQRNQ